MAIDKLGTINLGIDDRLGSGLNPSRVPEPDGFSELLGKTGDAIVKPHTAAAEAVDGFINGMNGNIHDVLLSVEKSEISLKFMVSVRNKVIEAYKEIMRMGA